MSHPEFSDVGKTAKDLLEKDFNLGKTKLESKTTSAQGVEFTTTFERSNSDFIKGELKTKYKTDSFTFTDTVNTDTDLGLKIEATNLVDGAKFDVDTSFNPNNGKKDLKVGFNYKKKDVITTTGSCNVFKSSAKLDAVLGYEKFLTGASVNVASLQNPAKADIGVLLGYVDTDYALTVMADFGEKAPQFSARYHHNINKDITVALKTSYPNKDKRPSFELGAQYKLDGDASMKGKVGTNGKLDFAYIQKITKDLKASFGLSIDTQKMDAPHQYGLSLTFEPKN